ncbi:response regulator [Puia sp. P3]|uniref:response regulator n=1 Tax=Puia sp. P3 TaxID=3423952 RepID=UPI003D671124
MKKILIVEDEGDMCLLLNILLDQPELTIDHVNTLSGARTFLEKETPTLVLLDNRLPDGMGVDFIGYIKEKSPAVKIIMISGVDAAVSDLALEIGADTFLCKPFTKTQLQATVQQLLN